MKETDMELDVKINAGDLYDYMLMHTYHSASGLIGSGVGALLIVAGAMTGKLYWLVGLVVLVYLPWSLFLKSRQQILGNPAFKKPLHYQFDEEVIHVSQGDTQQELPWENIVKAASTSRSLILYTSKVNATILPRREMGEYTTSVIRLISEHVPANRVKIRF
jgi:hypothetical protein